MLDYSIEIHESLPSSNNVIKRGIEEGLPEGLVVCTYQQTAGYGRLGRSWVSPFGGLYFSLLLRPRMRPQELPSLGLVIALALKRALSSFLPANCGDALSIKWPNDIVVMEGDQTGEVRRGQFRKVSGMSMERHAGGTCIGIGINVIKPHDQENVDGNNIPMYLVDLMGEECARRGIEPSVGSEGLTAAQRRLILGICSAFLHEFQGLYDQWCDEGLEPFVDDYGKNMCLQGRSVSMVNQLDQRIVSGVVSGVDAAGRLLLIDDSGTSVSVSSGEVTLL